MDPLLEEVLALLKKEKQKIGYPHSVGQIKYSEKVRQKVAHLLSSGKSKEELIKATGLSSSSLYRWTYKFKNSTESFKRLEIVTSSEQTFNTTSVGNSDNSLVEIVLPSGVTIKTNRPSFTAELLLLIDKVARSSHDSCQ